VLAIPILKIHGVTVAPEHERSIFRSAEGFLPGFSGIPVRVKDVEETERHLREAGVMKCRDRLAW
jgi:hypothetical protein